MKKRILGLGLVMTLFVASFTGCGNKKLFDTTYTFNRAIIKLQDGTVINSEIKSWTDYEDGEQLQVVTKDGTVYLTNSINCTLIKD